MVATPPIHFSGQNQLATIIGANSNLALTTMQEQPAANRTLVSRLAKPVVNEDLDKEKAIRTLRSIVINLCSDMRVSKELLSKLKNLEKFLDRQTDESKDFLFQSALAFPEHVLVPLFENYGDYGFSKLKTAASELIQYSQNQIQTANYLEINGFVLDSLKKKLTELKEYLEKVDKEIDYLLDANNLIEDGYRGVFQNVQDSLGFQLARQIQELETSCGSLNKKIDETKEAKARKVVDEESLKGFDTDFKSIVEELLTSEKVDASLKNLANTLMVNFTSLTKSLYGKPSGIYYKSLEEQVRKYLEFPVMTKDLTDLYQRLFHPDRYSEKAKLIAEFVFKVINP